MTGFGYPDRLTRSTLRRQLHVDARQPRTSRRVKASRSVRLSASGCCTSPFISSSTGRAAAGSKASGISRQAIASLNDAGQARRTLTDSVTGSPARQSRSAAAWPVLRPQEVVGQLGRGRRGAAPQRQTVTGGDLKPGRYLDHFQARNFTLGLGRVRAIDEEDVGLALFQVPRLGAAAGGRRRLCCRCDCQSHRQQRIAQRISQRIWPRHHFTAFGKNSCSPPIL